MFLHGSGNGFGSSRSGRFRQTFQSLSNKNFRIYSIGQLVSLIGTWMQITALPWLVYTMTGSASALGMVSFAGGLPLLLLTYVGGTVSDKFPRKSVMIAMQALAMLQAIVLFYIAYTGVANLYFLIGIAFFGGCVTAIDLPNRQSIRNRSCRRRKPHKRHWIEFRNLEFLAYDRSGTGWICDCRFQRICLFRH